MDKARAYMDWNATAPLLPEAREAFLRVGMMEGNPSSVHREGRAVRAEIEAARRKVAAAVGAESADVIFTSGATEAANLVLTPDFRMGRSPLRIGRLYVSAIEHKAVFEGGRFAKSDIEVFPVYSSGVADTAALASMLDGHDRSLGLPMVALMQAFQTLFRDQGIYLGRRQRAVAEHQLQRAQVGTVIEQVGRERMTQHMR